MIHWHEEIDEASYQVPLETQDVAFRIECTALPVDHAWVLAAALRARLPWFGGDAADGLHLVHGAASGNGWERPSEGEALIYLSRRTPLTLRLPATRIPDALSLTGAELQVAGHRMQVGPGRARSLARTDTVYARHVLSAIGDEDAFLDWAVAGLRDLGVQFRKVLCGKGVDLFSPNGPLHTRSLMVAGMPFPDAWRLQARGLGPGRAMGCGLFVAHKPV